MLAQHVEKFNEINAMQESVFERRCASYNNCSMCPIALHIEPSSHRCTYGMSEMEFRLLMSSADCDY